MVESKKELEKSLGLTSLIIYGVGDMLGAGIYALIGAAAGALGSMIWAGFLVSAIAASLTALTYASLGSRYPKAGGAAYISERALGLEGVSYVTGLTVMASGLISMAAAARAFASYGEAIFSILPSSLISLLFVLILASIVFMGMKESSLMNAICTMIELGGLLFIVAISIPFWGDTNLSQLPEANVNDFLPLVLLQGGVLTFYAFIGFEDLLNVAEEVKEPAKHFAIGILTALAITTVVYLCVSISAVSVVPASELAASEVGPLVLVVNKAAPWMNSKIFAIVALFAIANTALLNFVMASRLTYGMSKQGLLPEMLGRLHQKRSTPHLAIVLILAIVMLLSFIGDIGQLASATSILLLLVFILMNVSLIILKRKPSEERGSFEIPFVIPILAIMINIGLIAARFASADLKPFYIAVGFVLLISILYFSTAKKES